MQNCRVSGKKRPSCRRESPRYRRELNTAQENRGGGDSVIYSSLGLGLFWQLCSEVSSLGSDLSLAKGEGQRAEVALEEAGRSRAELARDKAALVVQLTASEKENAALSEELAAFRWVRVLGVRRFPHRAVWVTGDRGPSGRSGSLWKPVSSRCNSSSFRQSLGGSSWRRRTKTSDCAARLQRVRETGKWKIVSHKMYLNSSNGLVIFRFATIVEQTANTQIYKLEPDPLQSCWQTDP